LFSDHLNAAGEIHLSLSDLGLRLARPTAKEFVKLTVGHSQSLRIAEVFVIHLDAAILANLEELVLDTGNKRRLAIGRQSHHFVFAAVDFETCVVSESAIEQTQTIWEAKLFEQRDFISFPDSD